MKQPHMASSSCAVEADVKKKGYLLKVKTSKKKFFVVREETSSGPARLEYYDSEKKFQSGRLARRCILLKNCFSINAKSDSTRHRHMIVLYTEDDCFGIACGSESEQQDWLNTMVQLRCQSLNSSSRSTAAYKHVWPVSVEAIDGKNILVTPGSYRLCLTATNLTLFPLWSSTQPEIVIPLDSIRCCGHGECLLLIEVDRSSMVDRGELWLQADDSLVARRMHDTLVSLLEGQTTVTEPFRARSKTSCAGDAGGTASKVPDARRAVSMRLQALRAAAAPHRLSGSAWSQSLETLIKEGKSSSTSYFIMKPGLSSASDPSAPCDSGYIEMKRPTGFAGYIDMSCGRKSTAAHDQATSSPSSVKQIRAIEGYLDMMPHVGSSSVPLDSATQSLAGRLEVVRSYVQGDSESGSENSDESSIASLGGSEEHLPKERAYSVGCKPSMTSSQLHLRAGCGSGRPPKAPGRTAEKLTEGSKQWHHQDTLSATVGVRPPRKISAPGRPDLFQLQSAEAGSSKSWPAVHGQVVLTPDSSKVDRGSVEGAIRPRTSTLPWDLLRGKRNADDDPLRPRSSSGGNAASIRDAVRSRIAAARQSVIASSARSVGFSDPIRHSPQHRELVCTAEGQEAGEYVEMHCPAAS